jgi:uncharacterized membrane protein YfcA
MTLWNLLLLFGVGGLAGFINALAGGGSILTVPVLIFIGLPPSVANGTNRIAVVAQSLASVASYHKEKFRFYKQSAIYSLFALPGAVLGAITAVQIGDELFKKILAILTILIVLTLFIPITKRQDQTDKRSSRLFFYPVMLAIGFYGGFLQIGVGFLIMAALYHMEKLDLIKVNIHKVFLMLLFTTPALLVFVLSGRVQWVPGLALAVGNATGAWWGAKANIKGGEKLVRIMVAVAALIMAAKLFELF